MALITSAVARGLPPTCPVCGSPKHTCGDAAEVHPIDDPIHSTMKEKTAMTEPEELGVYTYDVHGNEVTGQLSKADAERLGARPADESDGDQAEQQPATKARKTPPANK